MNKSTGNVATSVTTNTSIGFLQIGIRMLRIVHFSSLLFQLCIDAAAGWNSLI